MIAAGTYRAERGAQRELSSAQVTARQLPDHAERPVQGPSATHAVVLIVRCGRTASKPHSVTLIAWCNARDSTVAAKRGTGQRGWQPASIRRADVVFVPTDAPSRAPTPRIAADLRGSWDAL
ncbi:MAG: hypothetical protein ACRDR6_13390 [Pseudonocardiaceae bacterium]